MDSKSSKFLQKRATTAPAISPQMAKSVSQFRRETLQTEIDNGKFSDGNDSSVKNNPFVPTSASYAVAGIKKTATGNTLGSSSGGFRGPNNTLRQPGPIYSPLWLDSNLNMPRDRATINAWSRAFFAMNGIVRNAISLHSTYPISKLNIKCKDKRVENFFAEMAEELDLINKCIEVAQEYYLIGEAAIYADLDMQTRKWSRLIIQNPDYLIVTPSLSGDPILSLRPDETLQRICKSNRPVDVQQRQSISSEIVEHVRRGENIPLDSFNMSYLANKINPYDPRGTGLLVSCFRNLMLFDQIREAKFVQANTMINPLTLIKIGGATGEYKPVPADLEAWREVFSQAEADRSFKIFTHDGVTVEKVGNQGSIIDTSADITEIIKELYTGLMVPSVIMDGGADTSYANGGVALSVLRSRYLNFRNYLSAWLRRKIFAPISKLNDFYEYRDGKKVLIIPDIDWNYMDLFDVDSHIASLSALATSDTNKSASVQTLFRSMGLNWEEEKNKIRDEDIWQAIREKEKLALSEMSLSELRTLTEGKEITEKPGQPLPGQPPEGGGEDDGLPGVSPPPGMSPPPSITPPAGPPGSELPQSPK
jgi:hypothetical protein